jgi:hypothetical protein
MVKTGATLYEYKSIDEAVAPASTSAASNKAKVLPLRGPIEMDPNQAADLLNEDNPAAK